MVVERIICNPLPTVLTLISFGLSHSECAVSGFRLVYQVVQKSSLQMFIDAGYYTIVTKENLQETPPIPEGSLCSFCLPIVSVLVRVSFFQCISLERGPRHQEYIRGLSITWYCFY